MAIYTVKPNQNLFDIALHLYGSIEGLFDLLISNPSLNMTSELAYGQELEYHEGFVINSSIVEEFGKQNIIPSAGSRNVYFKRPDEDLLMIVGTHPELARSYFKVSGEGTMIVDWGDNSPLQYIDLTTTPIEIEHYFDNDIEKRRIKVYGNTETLKFIQFDSTGIGGALILCRPIVVDEYICHNRGFALTGLSLMNGTYKVSLVQGTIETLLPIGDMSLQELDLTDVRFVHDDALDDYLEYIVSHYEDRCPCTVHLTTEPGERGYTAISTILSEPEWNTSGTWQFYINNELYTPTNNGTNPE